MNVSFRSPRRISSLALAACLFLGPVVVPMALPVLLPDAEAAGSRDKRKLKKFKKKNRRLKKQIRLYAGLLAAARRPVPLPAPFIQMVPVGDIENAADSTTYGAVPYEFSIGKYEVNLAQYSAFLNAVAATDTHDLYNPNMATNPNIAGISRSGTYGSFTYAVIGSGLRPVTYVNWYDAARFCNWLHNGRPTGVQDASTTERGAYTLDGTTSTTPPVNHGAKFWIPSEDEWYKAAYHQPNSSGISAGDFWLYPTASDTVPGNDTGSATNQANFFDGNYSVTGAPTYSAVNYLTDGGAYGGSASFYGTFDQGGNVSEWSDAVSSGDQVMRGGSWSDDENDLRSSNRSVGIPGLEGPALGFRIASP